jgi:hypothetical protein
VIIDEFSAKALADLAAFERMACVRAHSRAFNVYLYYP